MKIALKDLLKSENPLNNERQFCLRDGEGVASVVKLPDEEKEKLSSATPIPETKMLGAISNLIDYYMPEAVHWDVVVTALCRGFLSSAIRKSRQVYWCS